MSVDALAALVGFDDPLQFRYALCLLACFPLATIHKLLPNAQVKYTYSLLVGLFYCFFCFGWDTLHFVATSTGTYLLMIVTKGKYPWLITIYNLVYLTWGHYDRLVNHYLEYSLDWTLPQMILTCKLGALGFNYYDGTQVSDLKQLKPDQAKTRITKLPNPLEFYSYVFFFVGFLTGPWGELKEYQDFTTKEMYADNKGQIPSATSFVLRRVVMAMAGYICFQLSKVISAVYITTDEFLTHSLGYRIVYYYIACELAFSKYYLAWYLGEGACALVGLSYNGKDKDGTPRWDRIQMVDILRWKLARNTRELVAYWNMMIAKWLKFHIHFRVLHSKMFGVVFGHTAARAVTFAASAFWHGLYPGYYFFFLGSSLLWLECDDLLMYKLKPWIVDEKGQFKYPHTTIYRTLGTIFSYLSLMYNVMSFHLLSYDRAVRGYASINYLGHIIVVSLIVYLKFIDPLIFGKPRKLPRDIEREK